LPAGGSHLHQPIPADPRLDIGEALAGGGMDQLRIKVE
jgi:hypothetical protein